MFRNIVLYYIYIYFCCNFILIKTSISSNFWVDKTRTPSAHVYYYINIFKLNISCNLKYVVHTMYKTILNDRNKKLLTFNFMYLINNYYYLLGIGFYSNIILCERLSEHNFFFIIKVFKIKYIGRKSITITVKN